MAYQRYSPGAGGRFPRGIDNPARRPPSVQPFPQPSPNPRRPTGRAAPGERWDLRDPGRGERERLQGIYDSQSRPPGGPVRRGGDSDNKNAVGAFYGRNVRSGGKNPSTAGFWARINAERNAAREGDTTPEIPDYKGYAGTMWQEPDQDPIDPRVDTRAIVDATRHTIDERMAREGGEAAAALGRLGVLSSGGGRGMGYAGTLGESERARDRDLAGMYYQYDYDAAQQDANRAAQAREGRAGRSLQAHEGYAGRGYGSTRDENDYNRWKYGAQLDVEERKKMEEMMMMYGN